MTSPDPLNPPHFLRALASRNYRLYFLGQCVSLLGNWMTSTAAVWVMYRISGKPFDVGLVYFANQIPVLVLSPFMGVLIDRMNGLTLVKWTQFLGMTQSAALAAFQFTGHMTVPALFWLTLYQGFINALDFPARQTLTYHLAGERQHLDNVIALNSVTFNLARLVGPAIAGFVIAGGGAGACFTLDAVSYLAVLAALFAVTLAPRSRAANRRDPLADLVDGVRYAWHHPIIRRTLLLVPIIALFGFAHTVLAPVLAIKIYFGDARTLGFLLSATGLGSLGSGLYLTMREADTSLVRVITAGALIGAVGLVGIGLARHVGLGLLAFAASGGGAVLVMVAANTYLQHRIDDEKRGRVMSLYAMGQSFFPLGSLLVGWTAGWSGPKPTLIACGVICAIASLLFYRASTTSPQAC